MKWLTRWQWLQLNRPLTIIKRCPVCLSRNIQKIGNEDWCMWHLDQVNPHYGVVAWSDGGFRRISRKWISGKNAL